MDTFSERTVHPSAGQGTFERPKSSDKEDAPGLHGVEHQRSWTIWACPGQLPGKRPRVDGAGKQLQRPYVSDEDDSDEVGIVGKISDYQPEGTAFIPRPG